MYYIDPQYGQDTNDGSKDRPLKNPPIFADGQTWLFARGSVWNVPMSADDPHLVRTPQNASHAWRLSVGAYNRAGESDMRLPIFKGDPQAQHNLTFQDIELDISGVELHGGFGSALRVYSKFFTLHKFSCGGCKILTFGGKGLQVYSQPGGLMTGGRVFNNVASRDLSIPSEDAPAGDGFSFGAGIQDFVISDNLSEDSGHSSFQLSAGNEDDEISTGNVFINNHATGFNSGHCRCIAISGLHGRVIDNQVINHVGVGMTAWDHMNGVRTTCENSSSDYGITASSTVTFESKDGVCNGGNYPKIQVIARHGKTTQSSQFLNVTGLNEIIIEEQSGGITEGYLFDNCYLDGTVNRYGEVLSVDEANEYPEFNLIAARGDSE